MELHHAAVVPHHDTELLLPPHHPEFRLAVAVQHPCKEPPLVAAGFHNRRVQPAGAVPHLYTELRQAEGPRHHKAVSPVEAPDPCKGPQRGARALHLYRGLHLAAEVQHHNKGLLLVAVAAVRQDAAAHLPDTGTSAFHLSR